MRDASCAHRQRESRRSRKPTDAERSLTDRQLVPLYATSAPVVSYPVLRSRPLVSLGSSFWRRRRSLLFLRTLSFFPCSFPLPFSFFFFLNVPPPPNFSLFPLPAPFPI